MQSKAGKKVTAGPFQRGVAWYTRHNTRPTQLKQVYMKLKLKNPIVFFDLETTGLNIASDRIIEIFILKVYPDGHEESLHYTLNPEMPIPAESTAIHHFTNDDVKECPTFQQVARKIAQFIEGADLGGFNSNKFDIPLLAEELIRAQVEIDLKKRKFVDVQTIFHKLEKRNLEAAYKNYCNKDLNAHSAEDDTRATYEVLMAQLDRYAELENDIEFLAEFSAHNRNVDFMGRMIYNEKNEEIFNFGKYKGHKVTDVLEKDPGFYGWMIGNDFAADTKRMLTQIKLRKMTGK